jgi:hypothetical protein
MKFAPAAVFAAILLQPLALHAQPIPDFSGTWTMDPARSQSAQQGEPFRPVTFAITQSVGQVRIETTRGNEKENVLYALTKSRASSNPGASGQSEAYWDGEQLVTVTQRTVSGQTVTVKEARTLGPGGADMTVETTVIVQHGYSMPGAKNYGNSKDVFIRAKP